MKSKNFMSPIEVMIYSAVLVLILLFGGAKAILYLSTGNDVNVTVTDKGERCKSVGDCKYLIYTDKGTFEDRDSWLNWKFNSSDIYGDIKRDTKYTFHTNGIRVAFLSWYPNIASVQEVK